MLCLVSPKDPARMRIGIDTGYKSELNVSVLVPMSPRPDDINWLAGRLVNDTVND
jgi:hypothetical protein